MHEFVCVCVFEQVTFVSDEVSAEDDEEAEQDEDDDGHDPSDHGVVHPRGVRHGRGVWRGQQRAERREGRHVVTIRKQGEETRKKNDGEQEDGRGWTQETEDEEEGENNTESDK